ncbi:unnamed protein product [Linum trigynum]|uniref:Uncharacterized protein n=1 Tax=Linum trigynum TaxID=586398 RepID=A0AAV2CHF8_9ROSI
MMGKIALITGRRYTMYGGGKEPTMSLPTDESLISEAQARPSPRERQRRNDVNPRSQTRPVVADQWEQPRDSDPEKADLIHPQAMTHRRWMILEEEFEDDFPILQQSSHTMPNVVSSEGDQGSENPTPTRAAKKNGKEPSQREVPKTTPRKLRKAKPSEEKKGLKREIQGCHELQVIDGEPCAQEYSATRGE